MKRLILTFLLLGPMTAMAQEDMLNILRFNSKGPKVEQIGYTEDGMQKFALFDTTGYCYADGSVGDTMFHYCKEFSRLAYFIGYWVSDSVFMQCDSNDPCLQYIRVFDSKSQTAYYYSASGQLLSTNQDKLYHNHKVRQTTGYQYGDNGGVDWTYVHSYDRKGRKIRQSKSSPYGKTAETYKYDSYGNVTRCKQVIYDYADGGKAVFILRFKYQYDQHGNWTACTYTTYFDGDSTVTREITYWE